MYEKVAVVVDYLDILKYESSEFISVISSEYTAES